MLIKILLLSGTGSRALGAFILLLFAATSATASSVPPAEPVGAVFYVSPTGDDDDIGTSPRSPFRTLEKAQAAMRNLGPGRATTYLKGGLYPRRRALELTEYNDRNKSWAAYRGQTPVLDGSATTPVAITIGEPEVSVTGLTIQRFAQSGIFTKYADHVRIDGNRVLNITTPDWRTDVLGSSIFFLRVEDSMIIGNDIIGNTATGIQVAGGGSGDINSGIIVANNKIHDTCTAVADCGAIYFRDLGHVSSGQKILNNVIADFGGRANERVGIYLDDETSWVTVAGNIIYGKGTYAILIHGGDHNLIHNNIFDIVQATRLGLYQDDAGAGAPNYGMAENRFENNIVCGSRRQTGPLWDYIDSTAGAIAQLVVSNNLYCPQETLHPNAGIIADRNPILADPHFVDRAAHNYHLANNSPARNLGF